jgi:hypothetical protein
VISSSREKLRNVRMITMTARTPTLPKIGVTATVRMMPAQLVGVCAQVAAGGGELVGVLSHLESPQLR